MAELLAAARLAPQHVPGVRPPFELPSLQMAAAAQLGDVPDDSEPLFERGAGFSYREGAGTAQLHGERQRHH